MPPPNVDAKLQFARVIGVSLTRVCCFALSCLRFTPAFVADGRQKIRESYRGPPGFSFQPVPGAYRYVPLKLRGALLYLKYFVEDSRAMFLDPSWRIGAVNALSRSPPLFSPVAFMLLVLLLE